MGILDYKSRASSGTDPVFFSPWERRIRIGLRFLVIYMLSAPFLISVFGLPRGILYLLDILNVMFFLCSAKQLLLRRNRTVRVVQIYILLIFLYTLVSFFIHHNSILYYLWGLRNTFRFYLFFLSCLCWIRFEQVLSMLKVLEWLVFLNVPVCCWQFFVQRLPFDNIAGLFGTANNGSTFMNILLIIVTAWSLLCYLHKHIPLWRFTLVIAACISISILSELKAYYFELAIIVMVVLFLRILEKGWELRFLKVVGICVAGMLLLAVCTVAMQPEYWSGFFLPGGAWEEMTRSSGYSASGDLNRLTAVPYIWKHFFHGGPSSILGFGLGNCDYSGFRFLTTPFYETYQGLHYVWIHIAFLFLELGFLGTALYIGFFVLVAILAWKNQKRYRQNSDGALLNLLSLVLSVICPFLLFYDVSLRMESAYLVFFLLAVPFMRPAKKEEA